MKRMAKRFFVLSAVLAFLAAGVFLTARHGWRLLGFSACDGARIEQITVTDTQVEMEGFCPGLFPDSFVGYRAEVQNGALYVGIKHNAFWGVLPRDSSSFQLRIAIEKPVDAVYLKTGKHEYLLWDTENGAALPQ